MSKPVLSCVLALFLLLFMSTASWAEIILPTDLIDPVADPLQPGTGYTGCDLDYRPGDGLYLEGRWSLDKQRTMEGALLIADGRLSYAEVGAVWPMGMGHVEAGTLFMDDRFFLRAGVSGILPLFPFDDQQGLALIWDALLSGSSATSSIELGWAWCFGKHSFALAGIYSGYTYVYGGSPYGSSEGLAFFRLYVDERMGPLNIQGGAKAFFSFESGTAGAGADLSCAYMFTDQAGAGLNLRALWNGTSIETAYGINIAVRL